MEGSLEYDCLNACCGAQEVLSVKTSGGNALDVAQIFFEWDKFKDKFELIDGVYIIGDGSGICRGLSQSGAMGIYVADCITNK